MDIHIRAARENDIDGILDLVNGYAAQDLMLPRTAEQIRRALPGFLVAVETGASGAARVIGCGSNVPLTPRLTELRSLAVAPETRGTGLGKRLVEALVIAARDAGYEKISALTLNEGFFNACSFVTVDRWTITPKIWQECIYCSKFDKCDEIAVLMNLREPEAETGGMIFLRRLSDCGANRSQRRTKENTKVHNRPLCDFESSVLPANETVLNRDETNPSGADWRRERRTGFSAADDREGRAAGGELRVGAGAYGGRRFVGRRAERRRHRSPGAAAAQTEREGNCVVPRRAHAVEGAQQVAAGCEADLLLEASPVNLKTGEPGLGCVRTAIGRGMGVVLANKAPLVLAFRELTEGAQSAGAGFAYSATVCGALPVVNIGRRDLVGCDIRGLRGIFNSTSNSILEAMSLGGTYAKALKQAQLDGIAEADPSLDVEGWDTANKLVIIANSILGVPATLNDVRPVEGVTRITPEQIVEGAARGKVVKLVATAEKAGDGFRFSVEPKWLPKDDFLANVSGWEMGIVFDTDIMGLQQFKVDERGPVPTAAAMLRDVINLSR